MVALVVFLQAGWFIAVLSSPDPAGFAHRDWVAFHRTGQHLAEGATDQVYIGSTPPAELPGGYDGLLFLYPPFVAWITLPLAFLTPVTAYLACALAVALLASLAAWGLSRAGPGPDQRRLVLLASIASAPLNAAVILGHLGAGLLLSAAGAMTAWRHGRPALAGAALGLLAAKPNWGLPVLALLLLARQWRAVGGFLTTCAGLVLISLPLGPELWREWLLTMVTFREMSVDIIPPWRQATLLASIQDLTGGPPWGAGVQVAWFGAAALLFGGVALAWARWRTSGVSLARLTGLAFLGILATNPYAYFYDALFILPAFAVLWLRGDLYRSPRLLTGARVMSLMLWVWMYLQYFVLMANGPSLVGAGIAVWLILELADLRPWRGVFRLLRPRRERPPSTAEAAA